MLIILAKMQEKLKRKLLFHPGRYTNNERNKTKSHQKNRHCDERSEEAIADWQSGYASCTPSSSPCIVVDAMHCVYGGRSAMQERECFIPPVTQYRTKQNKAPKYYATMLRGFMV